MRGHPSVAWQFVALLFVGFACSRHEPQAAPPARDLSRRPQGAAPVAFAESGQSRAVVHVSEEVWVHALQRARRGATATELRARADALRLRESVKDLVKYFGMLSGAELQVTTAPEKASVEELPIYVGELASQRFGRVQAHALGGQAFRYLVNPEAVALYGESDLASSYAIYELLDRLGCRWYMPGDLGEVIPPVQRQVLLPVTDETLGPGTDYRGVWYADDAYKRRNRLGGVVVAAAHQLEKWIKPEQREAHPDWRASIKGSPHASRLRWGNAEVADAIAEAVNAQATRTGADSLSLSPADGADFDDDTDRRLDAGDWDSSMNTVSLTDRLMVLANRVAERTSRSHPDLMLGLLAYVSYTRPPVREDVHPNLVPVIAPITYCRQHPLSDDGCPGARDLRDIVKGWSERATRLAYRSYAYNLAEPAAPYPLIRKWSFDLPYMLSHKVRFFQPETLPNFETTLPGLYVGLRLAWAPTSSPADILDDLFARFYGNAARSVRTYLEIMDGAWVDTNEFSGGDLGYLRRFSPDLMRRARAALDVAIKDCRTDAEVQRVAMLDASLAQLELYLKLRNDLREGRLQALPDNAALWQKRAHELSEQYAANFAFGKARWAGADGVYANYFTRFWQPILAQAEDLSKHGRLLTPKPLCGFDVAFANSITLPLDTAPEASSEVATDTCRDTWSTLGHHEYFGTAIYRTHLQIQGAHRQQETKLWLSRVDGKAQAWLDGTPLRVLEAPGSSGPIGEAHLKPMTFAADKATVSDGDHVLTVIVQRASLTELGGGGLLGPVFVYSDH